MSRRNPRAHPQPAGVPRASGDEPNERARGVVVEQCSPRERG